MKSVSNIETKMGAVAAVILLSCLAIVVPSINAPVSDASVSDNLIYVEVNEKIYLVSEKQYEQAYEKACEVATDFNSSEEAFNSSLSKSFSNCQSIDISEFNSHVESVTGTLTMAEEALVQASTNSSPNVVLSAASGGVTKVEKNDWGDKIFISAHDLSTIASYVGTGSSAAVAVVAVIPALGQVSAAVVAIISTIICSIAISYSESGTGTGIVFDVHTASVSYLYGHKIVIPHTPYISGVCAQ